MQRTGWNSRTKGALTPGGASGGATSAAHHEGPRLGGASEGSEGRHVVKGMGRVRRTLDVGNCVSVFQNVQLDSVHV